ncbi:MAG: ArsR family transcriptional regulator [Halodesulfurarchaeum sp.]
MDEKTAELRDIFLDVAEDATVTESQEDTRGSLSRDGDVHEELREVVAEMREDLGFDTTLSDDELATVVEGFYEGESDTEIARNLGDESLSKTVGRARVDLHLVRDRDLEAPFSLETLQEYMDEDLTVSEIAEHLDVSPSTVRRYKHVVETQRERRRLSDRYREAFEDVLQDRELAERLTASLQETGLEGATEGQEVDVDM